MNRNPRHPRKPGPTPLDPARDAASATPPGIDAHDARPDVADALHWNQGPEEAGLARRRTRDLLVRHIARWVAQDLLRDHRAVSKDGANDPC